MADNELLQRQIAYYQARAGEYDDWFYRRGRYDLGPEGNAQWHAEADQVRAQLLNRPPVEHALELAGGTGIWTHELTKFASRITSLDAAPEVQAISRAKNPTAPVTYAQADLFAWEPTTTYDLVFFGFWLSHVPPDRLDDFLAKVNRALKPGGVVFLVDSQRSSQKRKGASPWPLEGHVQQRELRDGSQHKIVKIYYQPDELQAKLAEHGFQATVTATENYFIYAQGSKIR